MRKLRVTQTQLIQMLNGRITLKLTQAEYVIDTIHTQDAIIVVVASSQGDEARYHKRKDEVKNGADWLKSFAQQKTDERMDNFFEALFGKLS